MGNLVPCDWEQGVQRLVGYVRDFGVVGSSEADPGGFPIAVRKLLQTAGRTPGHSITLVHTLGMYLITKPAVF